MNKFYGINEKMENIVRILEHGKYFTVQKYQNNNSKITKNSRKNIKRIFINKHKLLF